MEKVIKVVQYASLFIYLLSFIGSTANFIDPAISKIVDKAMLMIITFCIGWTWGHESGRKKHLPSKIRKSKNEE